MEENNQNVDTGNRGVFPGVEAAPGIIQTLAPVQNATAATPEHPVVTASTPAAPIISEGNKNTKTFIRLETKNAEEQVSGIIEIDLISFREKGEENRYLSFDVVGAAPDGVQNETNVSISNSDYMEKLKQKLEDKKKQLQEVIEIRKNGVFKNSDGEITKIENQLIGEIQLLRQLV